MKITATAVIIALSVVIVNLGGIYAPNVTPGPGYVYIAAERNPANTANTGFYKVGGAARYVNQNTKRIKLNTGNPRRLAMLQYVPVTRTRDAEAAALFQLRQRGWGVNLGGGREWFQVTPDQWNAFLTAFRGAIQQYRGNAGGQLGNRRALGHRPYNLRQRQRGRY